MIQILQASCRRHRACHCLAIVTRVVYICAPVRVFRYFCVPYFVSATVPCRFGKHLQFYSGEIDDAIKLGGFL